MRQDLSQGQFFYADVIAWLITDVASFLYGVAD